MKDFLEIYRVTRKRNPDRIWRTYQRRNQVLLCDRRRATALFRAMKDGPDWQYKIEVMTIPDDEWKDITESYGETIGK